MLSSWEGAQKEGDIYGAFEYVLLLTISSGVKSRMEMLSFFSGGGEGKGGSADESEKSDGGKDSSPADRRFEGKKWRQSFCPNEVCSTSMPYVSLEQRFQFVEYLENILCF
jgi:hypothetical protein